MPQVVLEGESAWFVRCEEFQTSRLARILVCSISHCFGAERVRDTACNTFLAYSYLKVRRVSLLLMGVNSYACL